MRDLELATPTDAELIRVSLAEPGAFAALFDRHAASVHRYVAKRVGRDDAEDLVGDTFATAFRLRIRFDLERADARPWLFGIATNLVHHHWRSEGRRIRREASALPIASISDPADEASSRLFFQGHATPIAEALGQLDAASLDVLLLVAGPGLTYEEVAIALDIPVGTVRSRLFRARRLLRAHLGEPGQYLDDHVPAILPSAATEGSP
jgi:RNA polymerase sigma factor (sigma-70 family)